MATHDAQPDVNERRWWLSITGTAEGPYGQAFIQIGLKTRTIPVMAYVCLVGGTEWKSLNEWPEFHSATTVAPQGNGASWESPLINPRLPAMANWICIYAMLISPALWGIQNLSCLMGSRLFHGDARLLRTELVGALVECLMSFGINVLLFVGAIRLRSLRRTGPLLIQAGIGLRIAVGGLYLLFVVVLLLTAEQADLAESTASEAVFDFFIITLAVLELIFMLATSVWLHLYKSRLPLTDN